MSSLGLVLGEPDNLEAEVAVSIYILPIEVLQRLVKKATGWRPVRREVAPDQRLVLQGLLDRNRLLLVVPKVLSDKVLHLVRLF